MKKLLCLILFLLCVAELRAQVVGTDPQTRYRDTDQTLPAGLWRIRFNGNTFTLDRNTDAAGGFATFTTPFSMSSADVPTFLNAPSFGSLSANSFLYSGTAGALTTTSAPTDGQLLIGRTGLAPLLASLTGTANQVTVTGGAGSITLSLPQSINTGATPTFTGMRLAATQNCTSAAYAFSDAANTGMDRQAPTEIGMLIQGCNPNNNHWHVFGQGHWHNRSDDAKMRFGLITGGDTNLYRMDPMQMEMRAHVAQIISSARFSIYNRTGITGSGQSGTEWSRFDAIDNGTYWVLGSEKGSGGLSRGAAVKTDNTIWWVWDTAGVYRPHVNNVSDIGNGTFDPRTIRAATSMIIGQAGAATGQLSLRGTTSGAVVHTVNAAAGSYTMTWPNAVGASGSILMDSDGAGALAWTLAPTLTSVRTVATQNCTSAGFAFSDAANTGMDRQAATEIGFLIQGCNPNSNHWFVLGQGHAHGRSDTFVWRGGLVDGGDMNTYRVGPVQMEVRQHASGIVSAARSSIYNRTGVAGAGQSGTDWSRFDVVDNGTNWVIGSEKGSGAASRGIGIKIDNTQRWEWVAAGHYQPITNNAVDIGDGTTNPRTIYASTNFRVGTGAVATVSGQASLSFTNAAVTSGAGQSYSHALFAPTGVTIGTGTAAILATMRVNEPNITLGGNAVTDAYSFHVSGEPTEGTRNGAAWIIGETRLQGNIANHDYSTTGYYIESREMTAPSAPAANRARWFCEDNGAGKTRCGIIFPTGAAQIIATEP